MQCHKTIFFHLTLVFITRAQWKVVVVWTFKQENKCIFLVTLHLAQDVHLAVRMATLALVVILLLAAWLIQAKLSGTQETLLAKVSIAKVLIVIYAISFPELKPLFIWILISHLNVKAYLFYTIRKYYFILLTKTRNASACAVQPDGG